VNHRHRKVLHALFAHPISANIDLNHVESVFRELGAEVATAHSGKMTVRLNGHAASFSASHADLPREEVVQMRKFLESCGIDPVRDYPL
jgi:hypothetical protein